MRICIATDVEIFGWAKEPKHEMGQVAFSKMTSSMVVKIAIIAATTIGNMAAF